MFYYMYRVYVGVAAVLRHNTTQNLKLPSKVSKKCFADKNKYRLLLSTTHSHFPTLDKTKTTHAYTYADERKNRGKPLELLLNDKSNTHTHKMCMMSRNSALDRKGELKWDNVFCSLAKCNKWIISIYDFNTTTRVLSPCWIQVTEHNYYRDLLE